jgi:hypothetical protein
MVYDNVLEAIGHTPMVRLNRLVKPGSAEVLVKYEGLNVGGAIKTRTAFNMLREAERQGILHKDSIIVEPTSGNQGIGLALVAAVRGYRAVIIMPDCVSEERRKLVQHYGAEVIEVHDGGDIGACIETCLQLALEMAANDPMCLFRSSLRTRPIRWCTGITPRSRSWSRSPADPRVLLRDRNRRYHHRHRGSTEGTESGHRDLGGRTGKRSDPLGRNDRHPFADGDRRRIDPRCAEHQDL